MTLTNFPTFFCFFWVVVVVFFFGSSLRTRKQFAKLRLCNQQHLYSFGFLYAIFLVLRALWKLTNAKRVRYLRTKWNRFGEKVFWVPLPIYVDFTTAKNNILEQCFLLINVLEHRVKKGLLTKVLSNILEK